MSDLTSESQINEKDYAYANTYFYFLKTLDLLSKDAETQCEIMNYFNVAWEFRDDALRESKAILASPNARLSADQQKYISQFLAGLEAVPNNLFDVVNVRSEHLRVMASPAWSSLREEAKNLKKSLDAETARVNLILWPSKLNSTRLT